MNVLILGSGGREHAIAWKVAQSPLLSKLFIAPGNAGTNDIATNVNINVNDFEGIREFVISNNIAIVVVGPEDPLVNGIYDYFKSDEALKNIAFIGPSAKGAMLEGSKDFSKIFMEKHGVPTARYKSFTSETLNEGYIFLESLKAPYVLKADGLAAGKGVLILNNLDEAKSQLKEMLLESKFGAASSTVVIEEYLDGIECSVFVITDGESYKILPEAKDYKRIGEGDTGLNTGGMGAVSPVPFANKEFLDKVEERIVKPTIAGLKKDDIEYKGFIFIGLMNVGGEPLVIEYNCRMGDPETEVVMPRIDSDVLEMFVKVGQQKLSEYQLKVSPKFATTVMVVSGGYPEDYEKKKIITGLNEVKDSIVFHAGTMLENSNVLSNGGRVLAFTSINETLEGAIKASFSSIEKVHFDKMYFRRDIGKDLM